jgi:hypothetical protein
MTFMGGVAARNGKWSLLLDTVYLDMSQSGAGSETMPVLGPLAITTTVETDIDMKTWITTFGGGYTVVETERVTLDLVGGTRYL